jgi:hypothetical protein
MVTINFNLRSENEMRFFLASAILGIFQCTSALESSLIEMPSAFLKASSSQEHSILAQMDSVPFYSQASQDKFVYALLYGLLGKQDNGYYLEIGAWDPVSISNSYFFEKNHQWNGVSIDILDNLEKRWYAVRTNSLLIEDATKSDYTKILQDFPLMIDYLSLDIDGYYDEVLKRIPFSNHIFKIITIEHDFYRYGKLYREKERQILEANGYYLLCSDVKHDGYAFEDWWIFPSVFPSNVFSALTSLDLCEKEHTQLIQAIQTVIPNGFQNKNGKHSFRSGRI